MTWTGFVLFLAAVSGEPLLMLLGWIMYVFFHECSEYCTRKHAS